MSPLRGFGPWGAGVPGVRRLTPGYPMSPFGLGTETSPDNSFTFPIHFSAPWLKPGKSSTRSTDLAMSTTAKVPPSSFASAS